MLVSRPANRTRRSVTAAFTLIELLAVMAILAIMLALLAPAVGNFQSTAGRTGAVNILMNTMEQARVAALESGRKTYIVFDRRTFPEPDRLVVLRDPDPTLAAGASANFDQLTKWISLPKGVLLHSLDKKDLELLANGMPSTAEFDPTRSNALQNLSSSSGHSLNVLAFNAYGAVAIPSGPNPKLMLIVSEGVRDTGGTEALISDNKQRAGGFEIISLRRFTGRASLEVTTLN